MARFSTEYGAYEIDSVPGQSQIAHCHSLFVKQGARGNGLGHALKRHQNETLRDLGYDFATCTIDSSNEAQRRIVMRAGWRLLKNITNSKTGSITQLWGWDVK